MKNQNVKKELSYPNLLSSEENCERLHSLMDCLTKSCVDYANFDRILEELESKNEKLVEDEFFNFATCLSSLVHFNQLDRAIRLIDRSIVSVADNSQSYAVMSGVMNMRSEQNIECAKEVINKLISKGIDTSASVEDHDETSTILEYAAKQFLYSLEKNFTSNPNHPLLSGDKDILISLVESRLSGLSAEKRLEILEKIRENKFTIEDLSNNQGRIESQDTVEKEWQQQEASSEKTSGGQVDGEFVGDELDKPFVPEVKIKPSVTGALKGASNNNSGTICPGV